MQAILLNAVVANTTGAAHSGHATEWTFTIAASDVTTGATVAIQFKTPTGAWITLDTRSISSTGNTVVVFSGALSTIRSVLSSYTDGTYTVTAEGN